jgi:hypothetical protein
MVETNATITIYKSEYDELIRESEQLHLIKNMAKNYTTNLDDIIRSIAFTKNSEGEKGERS